MSHKKAMVELIRPCEECISMRIPATMVKLLDCVIYEVRYNRININFSYYIIHIFDIILDSFLIFVVIELIRFVIGERRRANRRAPSSMGLSRLFRIETRCYLGPKIESRGISSSCVTCDRLG
jgi:hypothetical protein